MEQYDPPSVGISLNARVLQPSTALAHDAVSTSPRGGSSGIGNPGNAAPSSHALARLPAGGHGSSSAFDVWGARKDRLTLQERVASVASEVAARQMPAIPANHPSMGRSRNLRKLSSLQDLQAAGVLQPAAPKAVKEVQPKLTVKARRQQRSSGGLLARERRRWKFAEHQSLCSLVHAQLAELLPSWKPWEKASNEILEQVEWVKVAARLTGRTTADCRNRFKNFGHLQLHEGLDGRPEMQRLERTALQEFQLASAILAEYRTANRIPSLARVGDQLDHETESSVKNWFNFRKRVLDKAQRQGKMKQLRWDCELVWCLVEGRLEDAAQLLRQRGASLGIGKGGRASGASKAAGARLEPEGPPPPRLSDAQQPATLLNAGAMQTTCTAQEPAPPPRASPARLRPSPPGFGDDLPQRRRPRKSPLKRASSSEEEEEEDEEASEPEDSDGDAAKLGAAAALPAFEPALQHSAAVGRALRPTQQHNAAVGAAPAVPRRGRPRKAESAPVPHAADLGAASGLRHTRPLGFPLSPSRVVRAARTARPPLARSARPWVRPSWRADAAAAEESEGAETEVEAGQGLLKLAELAASGPAARPDRPPRRKVEARPAGIPATGSEPEASDELEPEIRRAVLCQSEHWRSGAQLGAAWSPPELERAWLGSELGGRREEPPSLMHVPSEPHAAGNAEPPYEPLEAAEEEELQERDGGRCGNAAGAASPARENDDAATVSASRSSRASSSGIAIASLLECSSSDDDEADEVPSSRADIAGQEDQAESPLRDPAAVASPCPTVAAVPPLASQPVMTLPVMTQQGAVSWGPAPPMVAAAPAPLSIVPGGSLLSISLRSGELMDLVLRAQQVTGAATAGDSAGMGSSGSGMSHISAESREAARVRPASGLEGQSGQSALAAGASRLGLATAAGPVAPVATAASSAEPRETAGGAASSGGVTAALRPVPVPAGHHLKIVLAPLQKGPQALLETASSSSGQDQRVAPEQPARSLPPAPPEPPAGAPASQPQPPPAVTSTNNNNPAGPMVTSEYERYLRQLALGTAPGYQAGPNNYQALGNARYQGQVVTSGNPILPPPIITSGNPVPVPAPPPAASSDDAATQLAMLVEQRNRLNTMIYQQQRRLGEQQGLLQQQLQEQVAAVNAARAAGTGGPPSMGTTN